SAITSVAFSRDGSRIVAGDATGTIKTWDAISGRETLTLHAAHEHSVKALAVSPDGTRIAYGGGDLFTRNNFMHMCDFTLGKASSPVSTLAEHYSPITSLAFSPDSKQLLSKTNDIRIWDIWDTTPVVQENNLKNSFISSLAFSPDGIPILSNSEDRLCIWDAHLATQHHVPLVGHGGEIMSQTFSHDGTRFLFGSDDKTIWVWNFVQVNVMSPPPAHTASVTSVAFS
ncbi:hypothetical protein PILCRDRAFT_42525, partial [Piloderma croceum F 1598]